MRRKSRIAARIAGGLIVLCALPGFALAQNATWIGSATPEWNISTNWNPNIPGPNETAAFGAGVPNSITITGSGASAGALQFTAPGYTFNNSTSLDINGTGINASLGDRPTFTVIGVPETATPPINFNNMSSAGTAQIILGPPGTAGNGFDAGFVNFNGNSTAGQATITVRDQSATNFNASSNAGQATLIVEDSGFVGFHDTSDGAQAIVINNFGGEVSIADLTTSGTSFGSIAGAGTYNLGSKILTVGSNDASTEVSGVIEDHFPGGGGGDGGSLVKIGTGTLTLSGANAYTGGTTINGGTLQLGNGGATGHPRQRPR